MGIVCTVHALAAAHDVVEQCPACGVVITDESGRILEFQEKQLGD